MRLTVHAAGSRGDVEPMAVVAGRLAREGHAVALATDPVFAPLAERHGIELRPVTGLDPRRLIRSELGRELQGSGSNLARYMRVLRDMVAPAFAHVTRETVEAARDAEAVVIGRTAIAAYGVAEALRVPFVDATLQPLVPTRAFPSMFVPQLRASRPRLNLLSHHAMQQVNWLLFRSLVNRVRREVLDLPPLGLRSPLAAQRRERRPMVCGFSEALVPRPRDWPAEVVVTGFWQTGRGTWEPSGELAAFLADGPPPVFIAFGSVSDGEVDPAELRAAVYDAVGRAGVRALVQGAWVEDPPDGVLQVGDAPFVDLFGHVAAVVHQGGIGVTAAGLARGRPTVIVARGGDAFFWADRVVAIGAGPRVPRGRLDAETLAGALRAATTDGRIAAGARAASAAIEAEDGPGAAVAAIERALA